MIIEMPLCIHYQDLSKKNDMKKLIIEQTVRNGFDLSSVVILI